jgi:hypothetical protein
LHKNDAEVILMINIETKKQILITLNLLLFENNTISEEVYKKANEKILALSK